MLSIFRSSLIGAVLFLPLIGAYAQEDGIANTSTKVPQDPNLAKIACYRFLYAGEPTAPPITLVREVDGQSPEIIEPRLTGGSCKPYVAVRPEKFTLHVLDGSVVAPITKEMLKDKKVADPIKVELPAGGYRTLLIQAAEGKLSASVLTDSPAAGSSSPMMRVLDLSGLPNWGIQLLTRKTQPISTLWKSGGNPNNISIPSPGVYDILVLRVDKGYVRQIAILECRLDAGAQFSVILLPGYGNHGSARFAFDGTLGSAYDATEVKALVDGGGVTTPAQ